MNREDIIRMARDAGYQHQEAIGECEDFAYFDLERFAILVAAAEREACAKVCEEIGPKGASFDLITQGFAGAIRARGNGGGK